MKNLKKITNFITQNHLFQNRNFPFGLDLVALNIQRGRDHGLPDYNSWRKSCQLPTRKSFDEMRRLDFRRGIGNFGQLYRSMNDIDLYPAGLAEEPMKNGLLGPTFTCLLARQFSDLKFGDRFWYENTNQPNSFKSGM